MNQADPDLYRDNPKSTAVIGGHPIHPMLIPFPIALLVGAFGSDLLYLAYGDPGFADASKWLLGFGIATALLAAVFGLIDFMGDDRIRRLNHALQHMIANVAAVVVAIVNLAVRLGSSPEIVESLGVFLSGATVLILIFSGWRGGDLVYHHRVGVHEPGRPR
ncbi:MAG TPA: DUF2231 domain-containing protein [Sphingomicrobium sp.]|jgi:uncharacterized membrane protein|nr:DUF2231 domain-containing protein [Sphingomicrobium sp.]